MFSSEVTGSAPGSSAGYYITIFCSIVTVKMACDREEVSFIKVELVILWAIPRLSSYKHSDFVWTSSALSPVTLIDPFFCSVILMCFWAVCPVALSIFDAGLMVNRSRMSSPYSSKNWTLTLNSLNSDYLRLFSISSKRKSKTRGTIPISSIGRPTVLPVPIVWVFPEPVWP